jgi:hypothetical protein
MNPDAERLREALAEIAAYQGRREGAISPSWERKNVSASWWELSITAYTLTVELAPRVARWIWVARRCTGDIVEGTAATPRTAMRAAQSIATDRGW